MSGTRVLWGQIAVVASIVLIAMWTATEWTAWRLGFQPQLGQPWFELIGFPFYLPPAFFWWWYAYDAYAPSVFIEGGYIAASGGLIAAVVAIFMSIIRAREARTIVTYGSARWAKDTEIRAAGLLGADGIVLGKHEHDYLRHDGPEHVLCFAPTRSGKGVGLVVPTLLTWPGSCIVHDIKGEDVDRGLSRAAWPGLAVRSDQCALISLQPAAGGAGRRVGGARCPEHRRYSG
jgi:type IV secretion system protein VirD4